MVNRMRCKTEVLRNVHTTKLVVLFPPSWAVAMIYSYVLHWRSKRTHEFGYTVEGLVPVRVMIWTDEILPCLSW
jgi:hypothetical protein